MFLKPLLALSFVKFERTFYVVWIFHINNYFVIIPTINNQKCLGQVNWNLVLFAELVYLVNN